MLAHRLTAMLRRWVAALLLASAPATFAAAGPDERSLIVYVVGAKVPNSSRTDPPCANVSGDALYYGAALALKHLPEIQGAIILKTYNDGGCADDAKTMARRISKDPDVLAVIGHATSGTTQAAAAEYAKAGIPLLAPMATSPSILYANWPDRTARLPNVFRLPPGDDTVQAPAIAHVVRNILKEDRYVVVQDNSQNVRNYSEPLVKGIIGFLDKEVIPVDSKDNKPEQIVAKIWAQKPGLIIICAYPDMVADLVKALARQYENKTEPKPTLLLTDGARDPNLDVSPFEAFMTYPVPPIRSDFKPAPSDGICYAGHPGVLSSFDSNVKALREDIQKNNNEYELFAYDAMTILGQAIIECKDKKQLSRSCVLGKLRTDRSLVGAASIYSFVEGENPLSAYYLYRVGKGRFQYCQDIAPSTIQRVKHGEAGK